MSLRDLPLGIDIGTTRIRVAHAIRENGGARIAGIAVRDLSSGSASSGEVAEPQYVATLIEDAVSELGVRHRSCVSAIAEPHASMRSVRLPKMRDEEKQHAAEFEARRIVDYPVEDATIRIHSIDRDRALYAIGVARTSVLNSRIAALRLAKLKPVAMDHESCAFVRAFDRYDAVVDVGYDRLSLHVPVAGGTPVTFCSRMGGEHVTRAIARDLAIDAYSAERRKRILGTAGAGDAGRNRLASEIAGLIEAARNRSLQIRTVVFTGNGSRLPRLLTDVEHASGASCTVAVARQFDTCDYPVDVIRSAAADWTLAAALATWGVS